MKNSKFNNFFDDHGSAFEELLSGKLPESNELLLDAALVLAALGRKVHPLIGMVCARAKDTFSVSEYATLIEALDISSSHASHMVKVGRMMLYFQSEGPEEVFKRLLICDFDKLLSISRLERRDVVRFLKIHKIESMTREQVRDEVNRVLGLNVRGNSDNKKVQIDLFEALDAICAIDAGDFDALGRSEKFTAETAKKFKDASIGMLDATIEFWKGSEQLDVGQLLELEQMLRYEIDELEKLRQRYGNNLISKTG